MGPVSGTKRGRFGLAIACAGLLACASFLNAAEAPQDPDPSDAIRKLFDAQRWQQVVEEVQVAGPTGAALDYYYGVSLAQLGRLDEARAVLAAKQLLRPDDARFPIELGGVAFKQKQYGEAAQWLRRGLQLAPTDDYAADFLATIYLLQGNLEAALQYWNRIGKPQIESVKMQPGLRLDPVLLDRAFTFAQADTLLLSDLRTTRARIQGLGVFPAHSIRLDADGEGRLYASFTAQERNGFGNSKVEALLSAFRGVGFQAVSPDYFNLGQAAVNITSLVRWDGQKRRLASSISGTLRRDPRRRYWAGLDLRDERWELRDTSAGLSLTQGQFGLRKIAVGAGVTSFRNNAGWSWSASTELSRRDYRDMAAIPQLPQEFLLRGPQLKQTVQLNRELWRRPDRRFESSVSVSSETGRIWAGPSRTFERLQGSLAALWLPRMAGDDYATQLKIGFGKTFGQVPFDELFILGLERDNDLWMRAHIGTRDGRKGSAPLGRQYFLANWEIDKDIYGNGLVSFKLSPFLDVGRMDTSLGLGAGKWFWDTGVQAKVRVLGVGFVFVFGKDLRTGRNSFYVHPAR